MMETKSKTGRTNTPEGNETKSGRPYVLPYMQNRELSWLDFNKRVLDQGEDHNVPLLERLTRVSIFSSNLQEFFMVRVGSLTDLSLVNKELRDNKTQMTPDEQLRAIYDRCHELYPEQERIYNQIQEKLAERGIRQLKEDELNKEQAAYLSEYLKAQVVPYLSPQIINSRHPFPHLENGALYVLLRLDEENAPTKTKGSDKGSDKKKEKNLGAEDATFGLVPLPRQAKRVIPLPGEGTQFILLENALKTIVSDVFSMYTTKRASVICVTRNADIDPNDGTEDMDYDYREHMKRILKKRARLAPVRLETDTPLSPVTKKFLLKRLGLKMHQVYVTSVPLDMGYAWGLDGMVKPELASKLTPEPFTPTWPACLDKKRSIIEQVCEKDALLMYPYESMDPFVTMLREASVDPSVISIKITLYRLASQSHLAEALLAAAENGKEVTALFELRARFDESNNIEWSQRFEQAGANVIYGFHDFKVHSKICAITRHTDKGIQHITQLGTGNYNEKTSKLYTDFSFITTDESIGKDAAEFFRNMQLENASDRYQTLSVAPLQIKPMILAKIDEQIELARAGKPNGLMFKTNSVTDKDIIDKIAEASQAGVKATLFVRGISCLVPGVEGYTDNVKVVSIVGRLLEHSRIYGFGPRDNREIYLSSADLMTRNMEKRVEIAWPIKNEELKEKVNEYLDISLSDTAKLRMLKNDLEYTPLEFFAAEGPDGIPESFDSQEYLIKKAREDYLHSLEVREEQAAQRSATARVQRIRDREMMTSAATPIVENPETGEPLPGVGNVAPQAEDANAALEVEGQEATFDAVQVADASAVGSEAGSDAATGSSSDTATESASSVAASADAPASASTSTSTSAPASTSAEGASVAGGIEEVEPGVAGPAFGATEGQAAAQQAAAATQQSAPAQATAQPQESAQAAPEVEVIPTEQKASEAGAIQLVPKKPSLWTRIKFLFTGKLS
ncbi:polyphosphate kinase [Eggerthella sp. CAG:1427]|nr:polyphosphate kinase [Eggerthella sp. CAG:1427]